MTLLKFYAVVRYYKNKLLQLPLNLAALQDEHKIALGRRCHTIATLSLCGIFHMKLALPVEQTLHKLNSPCLM